MKEFKVGDLVQVQCPDGMRPAKILNVFADNYEIMYDDGRTIDFFVEHLITKRDKMTINEVNEMKLEIAGETNASFAEAYKKVEEENKQLKYAIHNLQYFNAYADIEEMQETNIALEQQVEDLQIQILHLKEAQSKQEGPRPPSRRFNLEERIMSAWSTKDDIDLIYHSTDRLNLRPSEKDELQNQLLGLSALADLRFNRLWDLFESMIADKEII